MVSRGCVAVVVLSCLFVTGCGVFEEPEPEEAHEEARQDKPEVVVDCAARSLASCERDEECEHFYGTRLDEARTCWSEVMPALCKPRDRFVANSEAYAVSPTGECWYFVNLYLPDGWRSLSGSRELYEELYDEPYPSCPERNEIFGLEHCE
jgi:hypothetical protein